MAGPGVERIIVRRVFTGKHPAWAVRVVRPEFQPMARKFRQLPAEDVVSLGVDDEELPVGYCVPVGVEPATQGWQAAACQDL